MNTLKLTFFVLLVFGLLQSCYNRQNVTQQGSLKTISVNVEKRLQDVAFSDVFSEIEFIPLETSEECLLGRICKLILYDSSFYIIDDAGEYQSSNHVYVFDRNGKFECKLGELGRGTGEHFGIRDIFIDASKNQLLLISRQKFLVYDLKTRELVREEKLKGGGKMVYLGEDCFATYLGNTYNKKKYAVMVEKAGSILDTCFPVIPVLNDMLYSATFSGNEQGDCFLTLPLKDTVYRVSRDSIRPYCYVDFGKHRLPNDFIRHFEEKKSLQGKYFRSVSNFMENKDYIHFNFLGDGGTYYSYFYLKGREDEFITSLVDEDENGMGTWWYNYLFYGDDLCVGVLPIRDVSLPIERIKKKLNDSGLKTKNPVAWERAIKASQSPMLERYKGMLNELPEDSNPILIVSRFRFEK